MSTKLQKALVIMSLAAGTAGGTAILNNSTAQACSYCTQVSDCYGDCSSGAWTVNCTAWESSPGCWSCVNYGFCC